MITLEELDSFEKGSVWKSMLNEMRADEKSMVEESIPGATSWDEFNRRKGKLDELRRLKELPELLRLRIKEIKNV